MLKAIDGNKKEPEIDIGLYADFSTVARTIEAIGVRPNRLAIANDIEREHPVLRHAGGRCRAGQAERQERVPRKKRVFSVVPEKFTVCPK